MVDYSKFRDSLQRLEEQYRTYSHLDSACPVPTQEAFAESVTQRFKTCYGCAWTTLRRHLRDVLGVADPPNSPKPIFRLANENQLLMAPVERWLQYANARISTSHDCDGERAAACLELMGEFIADARALLRRISDES